jgi:sensor histidine kinase YesM
LSWLLLPLLVVWQRIGLPEWAVKTRWSPRNGILDLSALSPKDRSLLSLSGEWEFYWNRLLTSADLKDSGVRPDFSAYIPEVWNNYRLDGKNLPGFGSATFRLRVQNAVPGQALALRMPTVSTAYRLYIDNRLVASNGAVGTDRQHFQPEYRPLTVEFTPPARDFDIILQVANYSYARGGVWYAILMGSPGKIAELDRLIGFKDLFLIGAFYLMAFYYLSIYLLRRDDRSSIYFAFVCLLALARTAICGAYPLGDLLSWIGYNAIVTIDYLSLYWFPVAAALLIGELLPGKISPKILKALAIYATVITIFTILSPISLFTRFAYSAEAIMALTAVYVLGCILRSFARREEYSGLILLGTLTLALGGIFDVLYQNDLILSNIGELTSFGYFVFLFLQSFVLAKKFSDTFGETRELSDRLIVLDRLKDEYRTNAMAAEIAFLQAQIKPHFLYNALNTIAGYCEKDARQAGRLILSLSRYLRGSLDFENLENTVSIERELELTRAYVDIEQARFKNLQVQYQVEEDTAVRLPPLTIQPLVENAIRHGIRKKKTGGGGVGGVVTVRIARVDGGIGFAVGDNGAGMPEGFAGVPLKAPSGGGGVGLYNIHTRLLRLYGRGLSIASAPDRGTSVSFVIPDQTGASGGDGER